jgi:hypothetical protein
MVRDSDIVGREIPKEYADIVRALVNRQGWRYDKGGKGHPKVWPPDKSKRALPVPTTPGDQRSLRNFIAQVRRSGGTWPVEKSGE